MTCLHGMRCHEEYFMEFREKQAKPLSVYYVSVVGIPMFIHGTVNMYSGKRSRLITSPCISYHGRTMYFPDISDKGDFTEALTIPQFVTMCSTQFERKFIDITKRMRGRKDVLDMFRTQLAKDVFSDTNVEEIIDELYELIMWDVLKFQPKTKVRKR